MPADDQLPHHVNPHYPVTDLSGTLNADCKPHSPVSVDGVTWKCAALCTPSQICVVAGAFGSRNLAMT